MKKTTKGMSSGKKVMAAAGIAAVGAGAYYLLGPDAKAHQKKASALMGKIQKDVQKEVKKVKAVSMPLYHKAVDMVSENYTKQYKAHAKDIEALAKKLKKEWKKAIK